MIKRFDEGKLTNVGRIPVFFMIGMKLALNFEELLVLKKKSTFYSSIWLIFYSNKKEIINLAKYLTICV